MAFIAKTAFWPLVTNHEFDSIANITGIYAPGADIDAAEVCSAGFLCVKSATTFNEGYAAAQIYNKNTWLMDKAESTTTVGEAIYACNTFDVNEIADPITGGIYKVGSNTLGLPEQAGKPCTFTQIKFDGASIYRFGEGNIDGTLSTEAYFTIDDGLIAPAASAPATNGVPYFEIVDRGTFTQGAYAGFDYVDVIAKVAVA